MKNSPETLDKRNQLRKYWRENIDPSTVAPFVTKSCKDCGELKDCQFTSSFTQTGSPEYRARCVDCHNAYLRGLTRERPGRRTTKALDRKMARKQKCIDYLGGRCAQCGYDRCVKSLNFHHREPDQKSFEISSRLDNSWEKLRVELDKCDLLCFNCHMEEHCELDQSARPERVSHEH